MLFLKEERVWLAIVRFVIYGILLLVNIWNEQKVIFKLITTSFGILLLLKIYKGELVIKTLRSGKVLFSMSVRYLLLFSSSWDKLLFWLLIFVRPVFDNVAIGVVILETKLK